MASLFKNPASTRSNSKTPKLKLPTLVNSASSLSPNCSIYQERSDLMMNSNGSSTIYDNNSIKISHNQTVNDTHYNLATQTPNNNNNNNNNNSNIYSSIPSTNTPKFPPSINRRPVPPPLPQLSVNATSKHSAHNDSINKNGLSNSKPVLSISVNQSDLTESLQSLSLRTGSSTTMETSPIDSENNKRSIIQGSSNTTNNGNVACLRKDLNSSADSYFSSLISAYEQPSSNSPNSPEKLLSARSPLDSILMGKDIDELDENICKYSLIKDEIITLGMLGEGAGGSVAKCKLKNGKKIFALKLINTLNTDPEFQKQIFRELQFNKSFKSNYIVRYYGMFADELNSSIYIAMEYMGGKSLDAVYKNLLRRGGRIGEKVLGKIAEDILRGLSYLHEKKVIHRDIKPQNILFNEIGEVKLCDFGVSGEAVNSLATTFTGTSFYMAPERIQGEPYSVTCDVWSLGLTILEVAQGHFPFGSDKITANIAPIELLVMILTFTPELKDEPENSIKWSHAFKSFIEYCLKKDPRERPSPRQMIQHPWIQGQMKKKVNMEKFISRCWED